MQKSWAALRTRQALSSPLRYRTLDVREYWRASGCSLKGLTTTKEHSSLSQQTKGRCASRSDTLAGQARYRSPTPPDETKGVEAPLRNSAPAPDSARFVEPGFPPRHPSRVHKLLSFCMVTRSAKTPFIEVCKLHFRSADYEGGIWRVDSPLVPQSGGCIVLPYPPTVCIKIP